MLYRSLILLPLLACLCSPLFAVTATTLHKPVRHHRFRRLHWSRWNPMFRPSHESLLMQNAEVDRLELPRIQDDDELEALKASGALQPIIAGETLRFDPRLDPSRRYCRPWTRDGGRSRLVSCRSRPNRVPGSGTAAPVKFYTREIRQAFFSAGRHGNG